MSRKLAVFDAQTSGNSATPWVTDGTTAGTFVLADVSRYPGSSAAASFKTAGYTLLGSGKAIFVGLSKSDQVNFGVYVTDGTIAGTQRLASIGPAANQQIQLISLSDGRVVFQSADPNYGAGNTGGSTGNTNLWVTDGTAAGTSVIKTVSYSGQGPASGLTALSNGKFLFSVPDSLGTTLWVSDATGAGTVALKLLGAGFYGPQYITALDNGTATFAANQQLWSTDGTAAGTKKVADLNFTRYAQLTPSKIIFYGDTLTGVPGLYTSDGTVAGTVLVASVERYYFHNLVSIGNGLVVYSLGTDKYRTGLPSAIEVYITDGTSSGTRLVKSVPGYLNPDFNNNFSAPADNITPLGDGRFLFRLNSAAGGDALWISDGTTAGTVQVKDVTAGGFAPDHITPIGDGFAVFAATVQDSQGNGSGHELWVTDTTMAGTKLVKDINPGIASSGIANVTALVAAPAAPFVYRIVPLDANKPDSDAGVTPFTFTVTRTGDVSQAATVSYNAAGSGTNPLPPTVINNPAGQVTFAAGAATAILTINLQGAQIPVTDTFAVVLGGGAPNNPSATATGIVQPTLPTVSPDALFDILYYLAQAAGVTAAAAYAHFLTTGWKLGLNPSALFNTNYYLANNPDVKAFGINPLLHFEQVGAAQGRDPSALFSVSDYLTANPDVKAAGVNALTHYLNSGRAEGRLAFAPGTPDPGVDAAAYYAANPDVRAAGIDAATHYNSNGWHEGRNPNAYFDTNYYLANNPDVKTAGVDPLTHFETIGWKEGREPSLLFSDAKYLAANPDVKAAGINPLLHYLTNGRAEGRMAFLSPAVTTDPVINVAYYDRQAGLTPGADPVASAVQAAANYDSVGWQRGLNPSALFDTAYYLRQNPDVAAAHINPLLHFETNGWKEGRNASAAFSTSKYLAAYADVRAAGIDPLVHYLQNGQAEGRTAFAV